MLNKIVKVFPKDRLKVQFVSDIKVGGNCLGITIEHDRLITAFFGREYTVHTAVVKLYSLSDAVWSRAQHNDLLFIGDF